MIEVAKLSRVFGLSDTAARRALAAADAAAAVEAAGGHLAVHDVDLTVNRGELFVVMGLSGSGKSTLIRMLNGLVPPTSGTVRIDGRDLTALRGEELRSMCNRTVNMVFQNFGLLPHKTVRDNAAYGLLVRGVARRERHARADEVLAEVGLEGWGDRLPGQLSGGMQQRVGLARALATGAEVLLMDEPFSALDPLIRNEMQALLLRLQADYRRTIVFVTHDLNEAVKLGNRVMVMRDGRPAQLGTALDIINEPVDDYETVAEHRPLTELCRRVGQWPVPLAVVDDAHRLKGVVPRAALLAALAAPDPDQGACACADDDAVVSREIVRA